MDAISFVLGVQSRDLRSSQMRDLIFRPLGAARDENLSARASPVYVEPSKKNDNEEEGGGTDGEDNSPANFLVFQGDVEAMTRKNPRQLVEMFENIRGGGEGEGGGGAGDDLPL